MEGINIFSGEEGLGGALTNPTVLAKRKGCIKKGYPIRYHNREYPDVELAYHVLGDADPVANDVLMVNLIALKFIQHPDLAQEVADKGGAEFLEACSHFTKARSDGSQAWEGQGMASRFIRNLVAGYEKSLTGEVLYNGQSSLF
jgi:hypothetical protein